MTRSLLLGRAAACVLCGVVLAGCGSRTGFLDGDGVSPDDDQVTGGAGSAGRGAIGGSGGSAGAGGLGLGGGAMTGAAGSVAQRPPDISEPGEPAPTAGCGDSGRFEGDVVIVDSEDFAQLAGCTEIDGDLQIRARVSDLVPLRQLREVRGTLGISRGPLSLGGLESLQQVQDLLLNRIAASSLQPLAGLRRVRRLEIRGDVPQGNLSGLGSIINLRELEINGSALPSLAGLAVPSRMRSITLVNSSVGDLSALDGVSQIDESLILLNVSGVQTLDPFASLSSVKSLALVGNPDLIHIDGVAHLSGLEQLSVAGNERLEHLPDFDGARRVEIVNIAGNPALRNVPRFSQATDFREVVIDTNAALERVVFPSLDGRQPSVPQGALFVILTNPALTQISAPGLTQTGRLVIADNPALTTVDLPALQVVTDRIDVINNVLLPSAGLGTLLTAATSQRKIAANQGDTPLASCPWTNDERCDETSNVCASGSDLVDCNDGYPPY